VKLVEEAIIGDDNSDDNDGDVVVDVVVIVEVCGCCCDGDDVAVEDVNDGDDSDFIFICGDKVCTDCLCVENNVRNGLVKISTSGTKFGMCMKICNQQFSSNIRFEIPT